MKIGCVVCGPDVAHGPLAVLSGSFEEKCAKAARLGFHGIELMVRDPAALDWSAVTATLDRHGLEVPQVVTGELFGADGLCLVTADDALFERSLARARSVVDLAAHLGAMVNVGRLRGNLAWLGDVPDREAAAVARIRPLVAYASSRGVRITLEPINRYEVDFVHTAEDGLRWVEAVGGESFGLMLDLFHMNIEDASIEEGLRRAGPRLWHVHVADSNRRYPGAGHTPFEPVFATLRSMGYAGYVSAEILPLPDPDTAAERAALFLGRHA